MDGFSAVKRLLAWEPWGKQLIFRGER